MQGQGEDEMEDQSLDLLIVKTSIMGLRMMAGIKAAIGSWQEMWGKPKAGEVGIGHPLLDPPARATGQCCALQDPSRARWLTGSPALLSGILPVAARTSLLPRGRLELRGELLLRFRQSHLARWAPGTT